MKLLSQKVTQQLQAPLKYGGFGITSTVQTSHAAYLASVASATSVTVLHTYTNEHTTVPTDTMLHSQLTQCIQTIKEATPSCSDILPQSASSFFSHCEHKSTIPIPRLQSAINTRATQHLFDAAIEQAETAGDTLTVARLTSITAPHASDWKATLPSNSHMTISDVHYRITALINLGLPLIGLPPDCHGCAAGKNKVAIDPYHYLSCTQHKRKEITIGHDLVLQVLYQYNHMTGGTGIKEPKDLHASDGRRPDLQMITNNEHILTDVQITNPLCPTYVRGAAKQQLHAAELSERRKINKYTETAAEHHATFIPFIMEATGGMSQISPRTSMRRLY